MAPLKELIQGVLAAALLGGWGSAHATDTVSNAEPGVWLEMGMLACERGEAHEAERIFTYIENHFNPPAGIQALMAGARSFICPSLPPPRVSIGGGWTSNANFGTARSQFDIPPLGIELRLADRFRPISDGFLFAQVEGYRSLGAGTLAAFGSFRHHFTAHAFDEDILGLSYQLGKNAAGGGHWRAAAGALQNWLGGRPYSTTQNLYVLYHGRNWSIDAYWQGIDYPQAPAFAASQILLRLGSSWKSSNGGGSLRLGRLLDHARQQARLGGDREGWLAELRAHWSGPGASRFEFVWLGEWSRSSHAYFPGLFDMRRVRRWEQVQLHWHIPESDGDAWRLGLNLTKATDRIPFLSYRQLTLTLGWTRVFP